MVFASSAPAGIQARGALAVWTSQRLVRAEVESDSRALAGFHGRHPDEQIAKPFEWMLTRTDLRNLVAKLNTHPARALAAPRPCALISIRSHLSRTHETQNPPARNTRPRRFYRARPKAHRV